MRPALAVKSGSLGKIQLPCCQGRIAFSESQRQTDTLGICSQIPRAIASRASSADDVRQRHAWLGRQLAGQRNHLSVNLRGEKPAVFRAEAGPEARPDAARKALSPLRDDIPAGAQLRRDLVVAQPLGGHQHHLSTDHCQCGNVYERAIDSRTARSSSLSTIRYGSFAASSLRSPEDRMRGTLRS